ncbi:MAG: hypothetical protein Q7R60_00705 [bacterium]|nr:hypothetical protein [bacterium]
MVDEVKEVPTLEPSNPPKTNKNQKKLVMFLLIALLILALGAAGWLYWQLSQKKDQLTIKGSEITSLQKTIADSGDKTSTTDTASSTDDLPVIVFSPGGLFTTGEKTEITNKMINPYKAWHLDQGHSVVSIHVQQNTSISASQYDVNVINRDGVYEGFLYGSIDRASQDWWTPTCMDACTFSTSFRATYPEVVAASER